MNKCNRKSSDRRNDDRRTANIEVESDRRNSSRRSAFDRRNLEQVSK
mgnify:CR=1 FL=1